VHLDGVRLDGNASLPLEWHVIKHLVNHLSLGDSTCQFEEAIGESGFAVIDMRDNAEIADVSHLGKTSTSERGTALKGNTNDGLCLIRILGCNKNLNSTNVA
jgi:hypothetical protein